MTGRCARFFLLLVSLLGATAHAAYFPPLARFTRPMAMGDAFTAAADGYEGLYYNPASMAGNPLFQLSYFDLMLEASGDTIAGSKTASSAFSDFDISSLNALMGKNLYVHGQFTPTLLLPYVGIGFITDHQLGIFLQNQATPEIQFGLQQTNGIQAAFGVSVLAPRRRPKRGQGTDLRVGLGAKALWRRGGFRTLPMSALLQLSEKSNLVSRYIGNYGLGLGLDLGSQFIHSFSPRAEGSLGIAYRDLGNTSFASGASAIPENLTVGATLRGRFGKLVTGILSTDVSHLTTDIDWRKRTHFGAGLETPFVSAHVGLSQLFVTYGASVDLWLLKVSAATYGEDLGRIRGDHPTRNFMLQLTMKFGF